MLTYREQLVMDRATKAEKELALYKQSHAQLLKKLEESLKEFQRVEFVHDINTGVNDLEEVIANAKKLEAR